MSSTGWVPDAVAVPVFSENERFAIAWFLAGYSGLTREAYQLDLRQFTAWCASQHQSLFGVRRAHIEAFARELEARGRARATIARRLCTVTCFYRYAEQEGLIERSPAVHVRRPRLDYESHATGLDRMEVGAMLVDAGLAGGRDHAVISLLALNGLRVSEAVNADIERLAVERGHRTLTVVRKGAKGRRDPVGAAHRAGDRSVCRGALRGPDLLERRRAAHEPAPGRPGGAPDRAARRDRQTGRPAHPAPRVHRRRARRGGAAARRAGSGEPRGPAHHDAR